MENSNEKYTYTTMTREAGTPSFTFAEVKYGKIVSINQHWVPLKEYIKFFEADSLFIDITGVLINGESPAIGDSVTSAADGYKIIHLKSTYSVAEAKGYVVEKLKLVRNQKELASIEYKTHLFDADKDSLMRLDKARQSLEDNKLTDIEWTTAKNERIKITLDDFKGINTAIALRSTQLHDRYNELKTYIDGINGDKYLDVILAIDWDWDISCNLDQKLTEIQKSK